uniref:AAR2 C-terminal domain-containing protein n=2 Tax=Cyprinus carpio TaxID=7962 RepID=A0A8C1HX47_CYPCA
MAGMDMVPEVARGLFSDGATLVLLGVPQGSVVCAFSDVVPELQLTHTKDCEQQNLPRNDQECQSTQEGLDRRPRMRQREGTELRFSSIQAYPPGATPAPITQCNSVLERHHKEQPLSVLGELQFAFVCFLIVRKRMFYAMKLAAFHLTKKFVWDFDADPDAVVVELLEGVSLD